MAKDISQKKRKIVHDKYGKCCAYCGIDFKYSEMQVDHITPKYRGYTNSELMKYGIIKGTNDISNLNPSCRSCNSSKSTFTIEKWREEIKQKHSRLLRDNSTYRLLNRFGFVKVAKECKAEFYFEQYKKHNV